MHPRIPYEFKSNPFGENGHGWLPMPAYILFFMMLFVPLTYQLIKGILLALVLGAILLHALTRRRLELHRTVLTWTLIMAATGLVFMSIGWLQSAPGAWRVGTVYVLWPLVYTVLVTSAAEEKVIDALFKVLVAAAIAIGVYSLSFVLHAVGLLPDALYIELDQGQGLGFHTGYFGYNLYSINSLIFLIPFLLAALMVWPKKSTMPVARMWLWLALILTLAPALLSARKGLLLILGISPLMAIGFRRFHRKERKSANVKAVVQVLIAALLIGVGVFAYLRSAFGIDIRDIGALIMGGFTPSADVGAYVRGEQFDVLARGWAESPIWGSGLGATAGGGVLRDPKMPWAYELFYMALLFQTGIVGFCIYSAGVIWIFAKGVAILRSGGRLSLYMLPLLVGTASFLIATASNPYLGTFDYIWVIFLPVAVINLWLLRGEDKKHPAASYVTSPTNPHRRYKFRVPRA